MARFESHLRRTGFIFGLPPQEFVSENIFPLIDNNGKIFRPAAPAIPTPESILTNPLQDGKAYRVFAPTGDEAVSIICYNLNTSPKYREVTAGIAKERCSVTRNPYRKTGMTSYGRILLFDWKARTATELTSAYPVKLEGFTDELFHLCPIRNGWAVIGIQEKYLSPAT